MWRKADPFNRATDTIALVTRGRNVAFDRIWSDLKQWVTGADPTLALARINATSTHRRVFDSIRDPGTQGTIRPSDEETLALISALEIYPLDFQLEPSSSLTQTKQRCRSALHSENAEEADALWAALIKTAETARLGNGTIRLAELRRSQPALHPQGASEHRWGVAPARSAFGRPSCRHRNGAPQWPCGRTTSGERALGLDRDLAFIAERAPGQDKLLVLDSVERLDATTLVKLDAFLRTLTTNQARRVVLISQLSGFEGQLESVAAAGAWPRLPVSTLSNGAVRTALDSVPALRWISRDPNILPLLANLRTLGWVIAAASSFQQADSAALTSTAAIADRLWARWTQGAARTQLQRLLVRLAVREADFERSFRISDLESGDLAAFDQRSQDLPLDVDERNRIVFRHDLAADWARYQRLKEIADDIPQWATIARQPLWLGALRLFGQFLLTQPD